MASRSKSKKKIPNKTLPKTTPKINGSKSAQARAKKSAGKKSSQASSRSSTAELLRLEEVIRDDIWPVERNVLFKPDRLRYVRKLVKPSGCVFCNAVREGVSSESLLIHLGEHAIVVLNKYPYNNGHLLVLPRRHTGDFLDLTDEEQKEINLCLRRGIEALKDAYQPSGFNVGLNLGSASGAGIPEHLHYHIVPRWNGDANFFALLADTKVVVETLEQTYARLLPYFQSK